MNNSASSYRTREWSSCNEKFPNFAQDTRKDVFCLSIPKQNHDLDKFGWVRYNEYRGQSDRRANVAQPARAADL